MFKIQLSYYNPLQDNGFWSPSTSASNFCEEDYTTSYFIAEFINTLSNLAYIYYAIRPPNIKLPAQPTATHNNDQDKTPRGKRIGTRDFHTESLIAVGVASFIYHATLRAVPQWFDESSMYLLAASFIHSLLTTTYIRTVPASIANNDKINTNSSSSPSTKGQQTTKSLPQVLITRTNTQQTSLLLLLLLTTTSLLSHLTSNQTIHSVTFGLLLVLSGLKLIYLIFTFETPLQQSRATKTKFLGVVPLTPLQRKLMGSLIRSWMFLNLGFGLWLVDVNPGWCAWLRWVRGPEVLGGAGWVGGLLGYVTELHGWWHFFTARAAGEYIVLVRYLTRETVV